MIVFFAFFGIPKGFCLVGYYSLLACFTRLLSLFDPPFKREISLELEGHRSVSQGTINRSFVI